MQLLPRLCETRQPHLQSFNACASHAFAELRRAGSEAATGTMDEALVLAEDAVLASARTPGGGVAVGDAVAVAVAVGAYPLVSPLQIPWRVAVAVAVAVAVGVGVGVPPPPWQKISVDASSVRPVNIIAACQPDPWSCRRCRWRSCAVRS